MAVKTKAQVQALLASAVTLLEDAETFLEGTFTADTNAISTAIDAGDDQPEDATQLQALEAVRSAGESFYGAAVALFRTLHPTLGRYAGSINLADRARNLAALHDKLTADAEALQSRGLTKFSAWTPGGGNFGNGTFVVLNTDPAALSMDLSHVETLTLRCTRDAVGGAATQSAEVFDILGGVAADRAWDIQGSQKDGGYIDRGVLSSNKWGEGQGSAGVGTQIRSVGTGAGAGNILSNGGFETTFGANGSTTKVAGWTISSGEPNVSEENTLPGKGVRSLKTVGNFVMAQTLQTRPNIGSRRAYFISAYAWRHANVTAGTLTVKIKDDSATHATITQNIALLAAAVWTKLSGVAFVLPQNTGTNLRAEIELVAYAGTDHIALDEVVLAPLTLVDGRAIGIIAGLTDWRLNDSATGATTSTEAGKTQRAFNRHEGIYLKHAGAAVGGW